MSRSMRRVRNPASLIFVVHRVVRMNIYYGPLAESQAVMGRNWGNGPF